MSTALTAPSLPAALRAGAKTATPAPEGARGLSALLLAAAIATLIVVADQLIDTWADGHLMLAWVLLWAVVFAGLALFADSARGLARRTVAALDDWSRSLAEARAEMRLWEMARHDQRLMGELMAARDRAEQEPAAADFAEALAPLGLPEAAKAEAAPEASYWERLAASRARYAKLHFI
ncbi:hypothetical protein [Hydrogenophaga sp. PBC]|uniref:hypothetical protein n=1 Tax=Hydrogenophaga sp. PBC TaxID=795665 RepID=UPI000260767A|nr:hypothetical protein [Hydrogenophaga sp. PBC]AOS81458.1 hypothetical protein Q5W_22135 [Hydrogenophaga sp. PBC]